MKKGVMAIMTILILANGISIAIAAQELPETADVTLAWDKVDGAAWYKLRWHTENKIPFPSKNQVTVYAPKTEAKIKNLKVGTKYFFAVTAHAQKPQDDGTKKTISSGYSERIEYTVKGDNVNLILGKPANITVKKEESVIIINFK